MICELMKVALILCLDYSVGVREVECAFRSDTMICVNPNYTGDCFLDAADDFMHGGNFSELDLAAWMTVSCEGVKSEKTN